MEPLGHYNGVKRSTNFGFSKQEKIFSNERVPSLCTRNTFILFKVKLIK